MLRFDDDRRARLAPQRAGVVETLRALAEDLAALPADGLDAVLPRLHRPLQALRAAIAGRPVPGGRRQPRRQRQ